MLNVSDYDQVKAIASGTGKPVLCMENMEMLQGEGFHLNNLPPAAKKKGKIVIYHIRLKVVSILPTSLKKSLKTALKQLKLEGEIESRNLSGDKA